MDSLFTRVRSRLRHDRPAPHGRGWLARVGILLAIAVIASGAVAFGRAVADHDAEATARFADAATTTSEPTSTSAVEGPPLPAGQPDPEPEPEPASPGPSAADDLAGFFAAAERVDQRLRDAAEQFNATVGPDTVRVDEALRQSVSSLHVSDAAAAIPAGLPPDLLLEVLIVQDGLTTRASALRGAVEEIDAGRMEAALGCLENGGAEAERFDADVAAAKALAGSSAPIVVAAPDSRAAGELALRLSVIQGLNGGCGACGDAASPVELVTITWYDDPTIDPGSSGTVDVGGGGDPLRFSATYTPGAGWEAFPIAC